MTRRSGLIATAILVMAAMNLRAGQNLNFQHSNLLHHQFSGMKIRANQTPVLAVRTGSVLPLLSAELEPSDQAKGQVKPQMVGKTEVPVTAEAKIRKSMIQFGALGAISTAVTIRVAAPRLKVLPTVGFSVGAGLITAGVVYAVGQLLQRFGQKK